MEEFVTDPPGVEETASAAPAVEQCVGLAALLERSAEVKSESGHLALRAALLDYLWSARGDS